MGEGEVDGDFRELNEENRTIWDANAEWWDDRIGDGNAFQDELIEPTQERLLAIRSEETVLDVGCGAGRFTRRLAELGAHVVAFDFSEKFIARARKRTPKEMTNIEYHVIDATDEAQMLPLGRDRFDAAVATVLLMDLADVAPLMRALSEMLKVGGRFVFSLSHPCFHTAESSKFTEVAEEDGRYVVKSGVKVTGYRTPVAYRTEGIIGQPEKQYCFHRPLSLLFRTAFESGFVIDGFEEPGLHPPAEDESPFHRPLSWRNMPEIPPILVVRMRLTKGV
ncbi:MAG: hypothetical protein AMK75_05645 [Planctomycetes bacterium SM23_65]|nr:MAG: hypothetical protein AMK75_05645 [Planctomycetes bacterium SM23_65]